jgi:NADH:ubiquinone oxidoreductase subunit E
MTVAQAAESVDLALALKVVEEMSPITEGDIIPLLQRLQDTYGYLPPDVVLAICEETELPAHVASIWCAAVGVLRAMYEGVTACSILSSGHSA